MNIVRTGKAEQNLVEIRNYISEHNMEAANSLLRLIEKRIQNLVKNPRLGPVRDDITKGARQLLVRQYRILYRIHKSEVEIVSISHTSKII